MTKLETQLRELFADNFVLYYKVHAFHFNVQGKTFIQDHSFLEEIYDFLWTEHDNLGEQLRQLNLPVFPDLKKVIDASCLSEVTSVIDDPQVMWNKIHLDLVNIINNAQAVYVFAGNDQFGGLETYLGVYRDWETDRKSVV